MGNRRPLSLSATEALPAHGVQTRVQPVVATLT